MEEVFANITNNKLFNYLTLCFQYLLDDCLVIFIEREIFFEVNEDDIIKTFMSLRKLQIK
jgi:hypothetical protein